VIPGARSARRIPARRHPQLFEQNKNIALALLLRTGARERFDVGSRRYGPGSISRRHSAESGLR
jgi:hypothetical protein